MKSAECIIIGGGIAGLQAAIQLGRYERSVIVLDSEQGRSTICKSYRNLLGWPDGVSGSFLRETGRKHAEGYGVQFKNEKVMSLIKENDQIQVLTESGNTYAGKTVLLATGVMDYIPFIKNVQSCLGESIYVCPDCDGYEVVNKRAIIVGNGKAGASLSLTLTYWTDDVVYVNHEGEELDANMLEKLHHSNVQYVRQEVKEIMLNDAGLFSGVILQNDQVLNGDRGFLGFGRKGVHNELAKQLGVQLMENGHIEVNARTKETSVENVWAAGDITGHSEQVTIAMGDGTQAAIWMHKRLLETR
ncbi:NAD(P)/FAD-dependent oxidoreductase [Metabacillus iocasae]|uniref:Thioredoxin reductase n=1 Tax=Priestia iocasae TaxID=2291674 RepID=A0ABS2QU30_9BACI|nr:NAD(P)/FAD-dependent oxidoreductase [Metabacillus iocasae]MBM7702975.1 thioredoxin reductase [Metabacillus iocasae]